MDTESDLTTASRDVLIAIIAQLQATVLEQQRVIERLERRIAELEGQAKPGGPPRMPGLKSSSGRQPPAQQQPSKQRRHGFARPRMTPTHRVEHVVESCPDCGTHLTGGWCPASTIFAGWRQSVLPVHLLGLDALLGSVGPVAGDVKLQDDGVVHDPVNRRGGGHGVGKDALPLGEDQV